MTNEIIFNGDDEVLLHSVKDVYPLLYKRVVELGTLWSRHTFNETFEVKNDTTVDCFHWDASDEGYDFWSRVHDGKFERASLQFPELFVQHSPTFINCFGVEMVEKTQLRADDDISVDFTKKKRLSDF